MSFPLSIAFGVIVDTAPLCHNTINIARGGLPHNMLPIVVFESRSLLACKSGSSPTLSISIGLIRQPAMDVYELRGHSTGLVERLYEGLISKDSFRDHVLVRI